MPHRSAAFRSTWSFKFTGFFGREFDANKLRALSHAGRVEWLKFRFNLIFLTPFRGLTGLDSDEC